MSSGPVTPLRLHTRKQRREPCGAAPRTALPAALTSKKEKPFSQPTPSGSSQAAPAGPHPACAQPPAAALARMLLSSWLCSSPQSRVPPTRSPLGWAAAAAGRQRGVRSTTGLPLPARCSPCLQTGSLAVILQRERNKAGVGLACSAGSEGALQGSWTVTVREGPGAASPQSGLQSLHRVLQHHH